MGEKRLKGVIEDGAPTPVLLILLNFPRLNTVEGSMCWKMEGCWKEVSTQSIPPALVPMYYLLVKQLGSVVCSGKRRPQS